MTADKLNVVGPLQHGREDSASSSIRAAFAGPTDWNAWQRSDVTSSSDRISGVAIFPSSRPFAVREGVKLELRAECFNFTNTPNFAQPNAVISGYGPAAPGQLTGAPTVANGFGSITQTAYGYSGRQFQFAGRFNF